MLKLNEKAQIQRACKEGVPMDPWRVSVSFFLPGMSDERRAYITQVALRYIRRYRKGCE